MELHLSYAVELTGAESKIYSSSVDQKRTGKNLESDHIFVRKEVTGRTRSDVGNGEAIEYAQIQAMIGEDEEISQVETTRLEPHMDR